MCTSISMLQYVKVWTRFMTLVSSWIRSKESMYTSALCISHIWVEVYSNIINKFGLHGAFLFGMKVFVATNISLDGTLWVSATLSNVLCRLWFGEPWLHVIQHQTPRSRLPGISARKGPWELWCQQKVCCFNSSLNLSCASIIGLLVCWIFPVGCWNKATQH